MPSAGSAKNRYRKNFTRFENKKGIPSEEQAPILGKFDQHIDSEIYQFGRAQLRRDYDRVRG